MISILALKNLAVALRKESVDRNVGQGKSKTSLVKSLSARRAWIEIIDQLAHKSGYNRRSPQGERG